MTLDLEDKSLNGVLTRRWPMVVVVLGALLLVASGCGAGDRASSWTGLTLVGERLYAADLQQARLMDAITGDTLWTFPNDPEETNRGQFYATPVVSDAGRVFFASQLNTGGFFSQRQSIVWALDAETGAELWRFEGASGAYVEGGALGNGVFVIGNGNGNVYALDVESGSLRWTLETGHRVWAAPLIVSDTVYVGAMDRQLYAIDLATGDVNWTFGREGAFGGTPALADGTLYIGAFDNVFYAVDAETGTERWHFEGEDWFWGSPAVYDDTVYVVDVKGRVYALNRTSGEEHWHRFLVTDQNEPVPVRAGPTVDEGGNQLFVTAESGTLYALDAADGSTNWRRPADGRGLSEPVVSESLVYQSLVLGTHRIRALQVEDGREAWVFPAAGQEE